MLIHGLYPYVLSCRHRRCFQIRLAGVQLPCSAPIQSLVQSTPRRSPTYTAICTRLSGLITYYKDDAEAGIMVTVLVLIRVTILCTNRSPLKGPAGITTLPACPRDLRSATVTSNYGRAVTILPTLLLRPGRSLQSIPNPYSSLADLLASFTVRNSSYP